MCAVRMGMGSRAELINQTSSRAKRRDPPHGSKAAVLVTPDAMYTYWIRMNVYHIYIYKYMYIARVNISKNKSTN